VVRAPSRGSHPQHQCLPEHRQDQSPPPLAPAVLIAYVFLRTKSSASRSPYAFEFLRPPPAVLPALSLSLSLSWCLPDKVKSASMMARICSSCRAPMCPCSCACLLRAGFGVRLALGSICPSRLVYITPVPSTCS